MKILAVDDNRTNLRILQIFLKKLGHDVLLAENGEQAVRQFAEESPDLVLLDIMMPGIDGFETARRIKAIPSQRWTPIILLSALNREENLVEGLDAGADDYLTKPINFVVLEAKLRSMQRSLAMQQASIDSLRRVQAISDNVFDAIVTADDHGTIVTVNQSTERIFGWTPAELLGKNLSTLMPEAGPIHGSRRENCSEGMPLQPAGLERELQAQHKDGHRFTATLTDARISLDNQGMIISVIRDISERKQTEKTLNDNARQLQNFFDQTQAEQQLALGLMERQLHRKGLQDSRLRYQVIPAKNFSGDIVAANRTPDSALFYALLADATGHGLTAAISVLPVLALFYRMTQRNKPIQEIVLELNQQLKESMPIGRFVAITLVCLDEAKKQGEIWVGGIPEAFLLDQKGRVTRSFPSANLPLGIVDNEELGGNPESFDWPADSQLIFCSDGLLEATNPQGEQFGVAGLIAATDNTSPTDRFANILAALTSHRAGGAASDDISLMLIDCQ